MAEQFIEDIYKKAYILEQLKECQFYLSIENVTRVMEIWKDCSSSIQDWCKELAEQDVVLAKELISAWDSTVKTNGNFKKMNSELSRNLIPAVLKILNYYTGIDVDAGDWRLVSADSGFLTLEHIKDNYLIYNSFDPMWESFSLSREIFNPEVNCYHILGIGLGYLPYHIWELSHHSIELYLYEDDLTVLDFAQKYGVLDWIDSKYVHIVTADNGEDNFLKEFFRNINDGIHYVSEWKSEYYKGKYAQDVKSFDFSSRTALVNQTQWKINKRKNLQVNPHSIFELNLLLDKKEIMIVSAGPSLNNCIDFIRNNSDKMIIIAINAVLKRLYVEKIVPDIIVMIDPLVTMREHLRGVEDMTEGVPLVTTLVSNFEFIEGYRGPVYVIPTNDEMSGEYNSNTKSTWTFGGTVTSLALELAFHMNPKNIYLIGSDLAYTDGSNYAHGVAHVEKENINSQSTIPAAGGGIVYTSNLYNMYRQIMERQIASHPDVDVYNLAIGGARIEGTIEKNPN